MKTRFSPRRNALLSSPGAILRVAAAFLVFVLLAVRIFAPDAFLKIFTPIFGVGGRITAQARELLSGFRSAQELSVQNQELSRRLGEQSAENRILLERAKDLEALLGRSAAVPKGFVVGVLARPPYSPYDTLVVGAGSDDGVDVGMKAFGQGGVPLGEVSSVSKSFSRITLFSASGKETEGWVGKERVALTLQGAGGAAIRASVPKDASIAEGDGVYLPGPGALYFGVVTRVEADAASPSATLFITPAQNPSSITWVTLRGLGTEVP